MDGAEDRRAGGAGDQPAGGVDARFYYANERTFLAWIRTSLGLMTAGLAITQLLPPFHFSYGRRLIGLPLIALGVVVALASFRNWQGNERAMRDNAEVRRSALPQVVAGVVGAVAVMGFVIVLVTGSGA
ncbi:MAG TPA: DUF202 domain-containing protein [Acidimicrobiales bacterium]|nr:DUF202 domain-containing protein [Acidimicrobiales bacterium]